MEALTLRVAAIRLDAQRGQHANLKVLEKLIRTAAAQGARLIVVSEMSEIKEISEDEERAKERQQFEMLSSLAFELGIWLCSGSISPCNTVSSEYCSATMFFGPRGKCIARNYKTHKFRSNEKRTLPQSGQHFGEQGAAISICETDIGQIGISAGCDIRLQMTDNLDVLAVSIVSSIDSIADWEHLLQTCALKGRCYIIGSIHGIENQPDLKVEKTFIINPQGRVDAKSTEREAFVLADIDLSDA